MLAHWIGVQSPSKLLKNTKTPPLCEPPPGEHHTQIITFFLNRNQKTCRIRRGFEQLSSYRGWRLIIKKTRANLLARAVVKNASLTVRPRFLPHHAYPTYYFNVQ